MISLLLLAAAPLAPQTPSVQPARPVQAALHPRQVVFYSELPDLPGLLAAYGETAAARMIADEEVRAAVGELVSSVEFDLDAALSQFSDETGVPLETLQHPIAALNGYLGQASGASFSVSLDEAQPGEFAETIARMHASVTELQALEDALYLYAVEHDGLFPAALAELELEQADPDDPWGRPYEYAVLPGGTGFELTCLGAGGAPAGVGRFADLTAGSEVFTLLEPEFEQRVGLTLAVSFHRAEDAARVMELLRQLALRAGLDQADGYQPAASSEVDLVWYSGAEDWSSGSQQPPPIWLMRAGGELALGLGSSEPKDLLERSAGRSPSTLDSPGYRDLEARLADRGGATVARAFIEFADLLSALQTLDPVEGINWGLLAPYAKSSWRTGLEAGRFVTESYALPPSEENALAQCVAHEPVPEGIWNFIPPDAIGMYATTVDAQHLYEMILEVIQADFADNHVSKLSRLEEKYEFSLADDVFASLGSGAAGYMLPISGLMSLPGVALVSQLDDPERFQKGLEGLLRLLEDEAGGEFQIKYRPYRETPLWYFSFQGGAPIPISPSLVIVDGHLLVTLTSTRAKKEIKRILGLAAPEAPPPELHAARGMAPADATLVGYLDWAQLFEGVYNGAKGALALMGGGMELPFDTTALPEAELFTRHYAPTVVWTQVTADAVYSRAESSFGPETLLGLGGLAAAGALGFRAASTGQLALTTAEEEESAVTPDPAETPEARPVALMETTRETARFLATRLAVYKLEAGRYPERLDELVESTENYPRGFLDGRQLPRDGWNGAFSYSVTADGSAYRLWSMGPDGIDQAGDGDDLVGP